MILRNIISAICILLTTLLYGQNRIGFVPIDMPNFYNNNVAYTTSVQNTSTYMAVNYDDGYYEKQKELTPLYINKTTRDFTLVDEKVVVVYNFQDTTFLLRHRFTIDYELSPADVKLYPIKQQETDGEIVLSWEVNRKLLTVTLWRDELNTSLDVKP